MCCDYYIMNFGEILLLLVILFLWFISISFFIKQFSKISTIERTFYAYNNSNDSEQASKEISKSKSQELHTTAITQVSVKNKIECNVNSNKLRKYKILQKNIRKSSSEPVVSETFILNPYNLSQVKETSSFDHSIRQLSDKYTPILAQDESFFRTSQRDLFNETIITEEIDEEDYNDDEIVDELLDPVKIPRLVRKHLLELHKKSQWHIAKKQINNNNDL